MSSQTFRIGQGIDIHAFAAGRKLVLGGCEIPHERGLAGHSDADVLLHAITDAVLGALGWGDIGAWFPDTAAENKNADSRTFLTKVWKKAASEGWSVVNCDCTMLAERPKLLPHIPGMKRQIGEILGAAADEIGIKATTAEKLGFVGREEGIAAFAVVLLSRAAR